MAANDRVGRLLRAATTGIRTRRLSSRSAARCCGSQTAAMIGKRRSGPRTGRRRLGSMGREELLKLTLLKTGNDLAVGDQGRGSAYADLAH